MVRGGSVVFHPGVRVSFRVRMLTGTAKGDAFRLATLAWVWWLPCGDRAARAAGGAEIQTSFAVLWTGAVGRWRARGAATPDTPSWGFAGCARRTLELCQVPHNPAHLPRACSFGPHTAAVVSSEVFRPGKWLR